MAAEASYDGTWNDWCWKTPDHWGSSSSSNPRAGWMWHDARQHSLWLPWNLPVAVTGNNPRQSPVTNGAKLSHCGMKSRLRGRPACWTPAKARAKNRLASGAGDSRRDQMSHSQQLRMRRLRSTGHRKKDRLTAVPRAGVLQQEVPSHRKQSGAYGEAGEENEASDDEWKIKFIKHTQKLPSARCRQLGHKKRQSFLPGPSEEGQLRGWCQQVSMGRSARSEVY